MSIFNFSKHDGPEHVAAVACDDDVCGSHDEKSYVIVSANAFVDPHAVMVKMFDTNVAG